MARLMFIVEQGGVPVYSNDYTGLGYEVSVVQSMRKALSRLNKDAPDVICAELNCDPSFRDRVSNLESLLAKLQGSSHKTNVIVFLEREHEPNLAKLRKRFTIFDALYYPLKMEDLLASLKKATTI